MTTQNDRPRTDHARLRRLLGGPDTAWLIERVRRRLTEGKALDGVVTLAEASAGQRRAAELLLGRAPAAGRSLSVRLSDLDAALRASEVCQEGLAAAVVALAGPVTDRRSADESRRLAWECALRPLDECARMRPELAGWRIEVERTGLLKRLSGDDAQAAASLSASAARVVAALPSAGIGLAVLAAHTTGDAHALDEGRPLSALVFSAVRVLAGLTARQTATPGERRAAWAAVGVARDELSSRVLVLGLPADPGTGEPRHPTGRILAAARDGGEPAVLTLRQLTRDEPRFTVGDGTVFICENPAVVAAAADELGPACPPLVCVEGQLSAAARTLLVRLADQGARFAYHGDFDWGGVRIATTVFRLVGTSPWRFDETAYLAALARGHGSPLATGVPANTPWDPRLSGAIAQRGMRVEEEHVLDLLIADLLAAGPGSA
ncbi:MAG: TIGR02679 family protein [Actinocrinis sp.]